MVCSLARCAMAQDTADCACKDILSTGGVMSALLAAPVTGEPFSAEQTNEFTRTLADGTKITRHGHHAVFRDAQGRVRVERRLTNGKDGRAEVKMIFVVDPVAHTITTWSVGVPNAKPAAVVVKLPTDRKVDSTAKPTAAAQSPGESSRPQPVITRADLGPGMIDNVPVTGVLVTTVVPAGRAGNDRAITKTHEIWTSDEMKLIMKQKFADPRAGERVVQLDEFSRDNPDAALFRPPSGYAVKDALETLKEMVDKLEAAQE
jgi:hypothetical protein